MQLVDNSTLTHADFTYDIADWLLFGANFRNYTLDGEGTVYNQDPDGDGVLEKISINEFGSFLQVNKEIFTDSSLLVLLDTIRIQTTRVELHQELLQFIHLLISIT